MVLGGLIKSLFGGGGDSAAAEGETVEHKGYFITPAPKRHNGQFLTAGKIRKGEGEEARLHEFVRADTHASLEQAMSFSVTKARQIIDEQGDRIFE